MIPGARHNDTVAVGGLAYLEVLRRFLDGVRSPDRTTRERTETRAALTHLYDAFARRDGEAMAALYAPDATFEDPVFRLRGADIGRMWIGLTRRAKQFAISYAIAEARPAPAPSSGRRATSSGAGAPSST